jgi:hypothetical protein
MPEEDRPSPAELAHDIMASDRPSGRTADEPPPNAAMGPVAIALYPLLRRHRRWLLPVLLIAIAALVVVGVVA